MFYKNFVAYLSVDGKVLREKDGIIKLPFGSEYSINLKNLESRLATVKIEIDGEDVLNGNQLVVHSNTSVELQGFMRGYLATSKFKFIEKTKQIEDYRGNKPDDGLIRVEFRFQKEIVPGYGSTWVWNPNSSWGWYDFSPNTIRNNNNDYWVRYRSSGGTTSSANSVQASFTGALNNCSLEGNLENTDGITVKGEQISQQFQQTWVGEMEGQSYVMVLRLVGQGNKKVTEAVTVKDKIVCSVCGTKNNSNLKYCGNCGNFIG